MWLNFISRISSSIHNLKTKFIYAGVWKTIGLSLMVIFLESFLLFISLPIYIFITPEKFSEDKKEIEEYRLKRKFSLIGITGFLLLIILKITLFSGLFLSDPIRIQALSLIWDFKNPTEYIYDSSQIKLSNNTITFNHKNIAAGTNKLSIPTIQPVNSLQASNVINWTGFTEISDENGGHIYYQLSQDNGKTWYYWDGENWTQTDENKYNEATVINKNISKFQPVNGQIKFKAFFPENNFDQIQLFGINLTYDYISPSDYGVYSERAEDHFWFYHKFNDGYWIFGVRVASAAIAIDSQKQCIKDEGEVRECTPGDYALSISIKSLLQK